MPTDNSAAGPLFGLRVLDCTGRMGGYCGLLLANLGAEVFLIEPPGGDRMRAEGPFQSEPHPERSLSFAAYHANKRGLVLDLDDDADRRVLRELVRHADALIEDRGPGFLEQRDLDYPSLRALNPALVLTSISGFGRTGSYKDFKSPSIVAFAMGGLMHLCGFRDRPPLTAPCDIAYRLGSVHAAYGTLLALYNRRRTGTGEHVEVALQDVLAADPFLRLITRFSVSGEILERTGNSQATTVAETYQCRDGYVRIFVNQPDHWRRFVEWLGRPPELLDPKLENVQDRFPLRQQIDRLVEARSLNYDAKKFFEEFQGLRLAAAPVHSPGGFVADEQTRHRNYLQELEHPYLGMFEFPGDPYRFSETPARVRRAAPLLGEHQQAGDALSEASIWLGETPKPAAATSSAKGSLAGVRVISFPTGVVGPAVAGLLADHGAEVIAIEPRRGARGQKFQIAADLESNRNRKRIAIDMKHPDGVSLAKKLIAKSDVVVENYSARVMASWGLDYPRVKEICPTIVMASLQAFGQTGPRRDYVSFGPILMAYSGMAYLWRDPEIERPGVACQTAFPDFVAPAFGALAIAAALHHRARTGQGQYIDISQAETAAAMIAPAYVEYLVCGHEPQPQGNASAAFAPHGCYRCKGEDRWCVIAIESQEQWLRFCELAGHREWLSDARFAEPSARLAHRQELDYWVGKWTAQYTPHQVMVMLQRAGIPAGAVQNAEDLYRDPHLRERGSAREVFHPHVGWLTRVGATVRFAGQSCSIDNVAHAAGEDNEAVLGEILGMPRDQIRDLVERQVLR